MISENREFSKKKGVPCISAVGVCEKKKKYFCTNGADELQGAVPRFPNLEAVSRGKYPDCVAKLHIYHDEDNYCDVSTCR